MNTININSTDLSLIFWRKILDNSFLKKRTMQKDFLKKIDSLDELRLQSSYNTGSVSSTTSWLLFSITLFFKPKIICEVGSFIGKSTFSMAFAADIYSKEHKCLIYCCDISNEINFPNITSTKIKQFHKKSSTEMLKSFESDQKIDLLHLDGRLQNEDFDLLKNNLTEKTILILDDFEGNEKGVVNFINLLNNNLISRKSHCLIFPIQDETKTKYSLLERSTSAVLIPLELLRITAQ
tara:strand:- start:15 stop:725 length:711 start_codon:yes stop_codon:yes gene_type:complete